MGKRLSMIVAVVIAVTLSGCVLGAGSGSDLSRADLARAAATGAVAAAARGEALELSYRFGRDFDDAAVALIQETVPSSLGGDPKMYTATIASEAKPEVDDTIQVIVRQDMVEPSSPLEFQVTLRWNEAKPSSSPEESATPDWDVVSIEMR